jgi:trans-aconitate methyltransferase
MINHFNHSLLFLFCSFINMACFAMEDGWDPILYQESSGMQKRWAYVVLGLIDFKSAKSIMDIGSGDGVITLNIAQRHPNAMVIGLDLSEKMVFFANKTHQNQKNLLFIQGDAQKLPFINHFDVVVSFNTMHRLPDPKAAIQGIFNALNPKGKFIAAFPVSGSPIMSEAIAAVDTKEKWHSYFKQPDRKSYNLSDNEYQQWLEEAGFIVIKSRIKWEDEVFESRIKFRDLLRATFSHRAFLPAEKEIEFFEEIVDEYIKKSPLDEKGCVHFYFNRIEIIAVKPNILGAAKL